MDKKTVLPGDFVSTEEEFEPGKNVFEENGDIFSDSAGSVNEDRQAKQVSVIKPVEVVPVKRGDIVIGEVMFVRDSSVVLAIFPENTESVRVALPYSSASLPVRMVSQDYVENLHAIFKIGDIVKAKVAAIHADCIDVRTDEEELGVVKAFCTKCRKPMHKFGENLKCPSCGNTEDRKISDGYLFK